MAFFACEKSAGENGAILTCGTPFPTEHLSFVSHICQMPTSTVSRSPNLMTKFENSVKWSSLDNGLSKTNQIK